MNDQNIDDSLNIFYTNEFEQEVKTDPLIVRTVGDQTINGDKIFTGTVTLENEIIHNSTSFSTEDGIIEQLKGNSSDMLDYGNYAVYNDGTGIKYKGIINKKQTDKFYVFHNQTNQPVTNLNLATQSLGSLVVREPVEYNEVATKNYVENHAGGNFLPLSGGTLTGNLNMGNNEITNVKDLRFDDGEVFNDIVFPASNRLTIGAHGDDFFMHFNAIGGNELIEIMKETNVHGDINMLNAKRIFGLLNPLSNDEPANKSYADTKLSLSGGTMTGNFTMPNNGQIFFPGTSGGISSGGTTLTINSTEVALNDRLNMNGDYIINVADALNDDNAVNKRVLDAGLNTKLNLTGGTMSGQLDFSNDITMTTPISGDGKIRIGLGAAPTDKGNNSVAIGSYSGQENQGAGAVAIGAAAGFGSQGANAIALGNLAGYTGNNGSTSQAANSTVLNATGAFYTTGTANSFNVKPIRNVSSSNNVLKYDPTTGEITHDTASSGEVVRYVNFTQNGFNPTGFGTTFVCNLPSTIPDGDYYFDFEVYFKYQDNNTNADGFKFVVFPEYSVAPTHEVATVFEMKNVVISSSNNVYGSASLKWFDTRTSLTNNSTVRIGVSFNGGGALNFDVDIRGKVVKK